MEEDQKEKGKKTPQGQLKRTTTTRNHPHLPPDKHMAASHHLIPNCKPTALSTCDSLETTTYTHILVSFFFICI